MESKEQKRRESLREKAANFWDLPADAVAGLPVLELTGERELRLENYRGILLCERAHIEVDGGAFVLGIEGEDLEIRVLRARALLIVGRISCLTLR